MTEWGTALLTWLVAGDTWLRLTLHAEPTAVVLVALVVAVAVLAITAAVIVRGALRSAARLAGGTAPHVRATGQASTCLTLVHRPAGGRGARSPGQGSDPATGYLR